MFGLFKKKETPADIAERIYVSVIEVFSQLHVVQTLALMHREAITTGVSVDEGIHMLDEKLKEFHGE